MGRIVEGLVAGLMAVAVIALPACAGPLAAGDLQGTWTLREVRSRPVQPATPEALPRFTIKGQAIEGFDGCNQFWGRLDQPGSIGSTRRGCPDGTLKLPLDLADPWAHLRAGRLDRARLILPERGGLPPAVFERAH
jgi:hypothetical protein